MKSGPIIIIEDDLDDQELYKDVFKDLNVLNQLKFFTNGRDALTYLRETTDSPFIILCDINMPQVNGIEVRNTINSDEELSRKSIPFIFMTTSASMQVINAAYYMSVQGFFQKPPSYDEIKETIKEILAYWSKCKHPNSV